ncbi:MAG: hypothetical protein ACLRJV_18315 [Eubacteriales bacterium]
MVPAPEYCHPVGHLKGQIDVMGDEDHRPPSRPPAPENIEEPPAPSPTMPGGLVARIKLAPLSTAVDTSTLLAMRRS